MLVEFSVSNYRSIRDRQTLSLVASAGKELRDSHVMSTEAPSTPDLLRSLVVYGANASGKSNLLLALLFVRDLVRDSARRSKPDEPIPYQPFAVGATAGMNTPSQFEVIFVQAGVRYQYGIVVSALTVVGEWLYAFPEGRQQMWFRREAAPQSGEASWEFGPSLRGQKKLWQEATRPNALYLSTAVQLNAEQLKPVYDWFSVALRNIGPFARVREDFTTRQCDRDETWKSRVLEFLVAADLGISEIRMDRQKFDPASFDESMPEPIRAYFAEQMKDREIAEVSLTHSARNGQKLTLPLAEESGGTNKIFALAGPWIDVLTNGYILIIDELDTSLHPELLRHLVRLINNPKINQKGAQLIFSTHDTSLLDADLFRRDQVWFMEKDTELASHLYPLTDFSPRKGENLEKGYLQGRYGALPFFGGLKV
ncbi:MAG: ATP-binding protein [Xanthomonadales bacterium]|nr:ATP-binding protein [Xanthomonadales bacterium]